MGARGLKVKQSNKFSALLDSTMAKIQKGEIRNPAGMTKEQGRKTAMARDLLLPLVPDSVELIKLAISQARENPRQMMEGLKAAQQVLDRVYGKPQQNVELSGKIESVAVIIGEKTK